MKTKRKYYRFISVSALTPDELFAELKKLRPCEKCKFHCADICDDCRWLISNIDQFTPKPTGKTLSEILKEFDQIPDICTKNKILYDALLYGEKDLIPRVEAIALAMGYVERGGLWFKEGNRVQLSTTIPEIMEKKP